MNLNSSVEILYLKKLIFIKKNNIKEEVCEKSIIHHISKNIGNKKKKMR